MTFDKYYIDKTVQELLSERKRIQLNGLSFQRKFFWSNEQSSLLLHSFMVGFPMPPVIALDPLDDDLCIVDVL